MKILIQKEKHGDCYYDVSTPKKLYETCRYILQQRLDYGYYFDHPKPENKTGFKDVDEINKLPDGQAKQAAMGVWSNYIAAQTRFKIHDKFMTKVKNSVKIGFEDYKPRTPNEKTIEPLALLYERNNYEYECIEISSVEDIEKVMQEEWCKNK